MKIGIFTDTFFPQVNGVTFTIANWRDRLEKRGFEVEIFYPDGEYTPGPGEYPFTSFEFKFYKGYKIAAPLSILKKAKDLDVVHIHGLFSMAIAGLLVSKKLGLPRVLTYHTPADEYIHYVTSSRRIEQMLIDIYNAWEKRLLNSCDLVTCPSNTIKQRLLEKGIINPVVLSNGVDLGFFHRVDTTAFREKYKITSERTLGFCGRFGYEKHIEDLIGIADEFEGEILIAGRGPAEDYYRKLAKEKENVKVLGFLPRDELLAFYSALDIFVFPSTAETQGLVALESMACKVPVVGANAMALRDTIKPGVNGYLYERDKKGDLMEKINLAYKNYESLSNNCLESVNEHSLERTADRLVEIYTGLV